MSAIGGGSCVRVAPPGVVAEHHHRAPDDHDEVGQEHDGGGDAEEPEQPPLAHTDLAILQRPPGFETGKNLNCLEPFCKRGRKTEQVDNEAENSSIVEIGRGSKSAELLIPE